MSAAAEDARAAATLDTGELFDDLARLDRAIMRTRRYLEHLGLFGTTTDLKMSRAILRAHTYRYDEVVRELRARATVDHGVAERLGVYLFGFDEAAS